MQLLGEGWRNPIWDHPGMTIDRRYAFRVRRGNLFAAFIAIDEMQQRMNHSGELGDADERARDAIAARIARLGPDAVRAIEDWSIAHVAALVDAAHEALASGCAATPEQPLGSCSQRNTDALLRDLLVQARANR